MPRNINVVLEDLKKYNFNVTNDNGIFHTANKAKYSGDYTSKSIKRTKLKNCIFHMASFDNAAVTGSFFEECKFSKCSMAKADFEFCNFEKCEFIDTPFQDESFNNSTFYDVHIINSPFNSCTLTGVHFKDISFLNADIVHCTLEGTIFENCALQNMNLTQLNMEYAELKNVTMNNVILPFSQIPYIFGGIEYIKNTDDKILISTDGTLKITPQEYLDNAIKFLVEYYEVQGCHFPLVNIYLGLNDIAKAYEHIKLGMQQCVVAKDFRMLKYFCKLVAQSNVFTYKQLNSMYTLIQKYFPQDTLNKQQLYSYSKHIGEIKAVLFSKHNVPRMTFSIKTNIELDNFQTLSNFLEDIFQLKNKICNTGHTAQIMLAQNSPFMVNLDITDALPNLCFFAMLLIKLINESSLLYERYLESYNVCANITNTNLLDTMIPLFKVVENQKRYYLQRNVNFCVDEILFYNIDPSVKTNLQYFYINKRQGYTLTGE